MTKPHSWIPVDLLGTGGEAATPPTIGGLAYPGLRHLFLGEPESLKTWLALVLSVQEIRAGRIAVYLDFESSPREMLGRLRDLGLSDEEIDANFVYLHPSEPIGTGAAAADLAQLIDRHRPAVVIVDATVGALSLHGLDPDRAVDIERLHRALIDPLAAHGAAVILIDHVAKATDGRGRWATGSERKIGRVDVALSVEIVHPFGRGRTGLARITTSKDRPGYLPRGRAAELELASDPDTGRITWTIRPATDTTADTTAGETFRPTILMEKVSRYLEQQTEPISRNQIETNVTGRAAYLRQAIDTLITEAHVTETRRGTTRLYTLVRPFVHNSSPVVPDEPPTTSSLRPPPYRGDERDGDEVERLLRDHADLLVPSTNGTRSTP